MKTPYDKSTTDLDAKRTEHEAQDMLLVEVQNHEDGDFLIFDTPQTPTPSTEARFAEIEARLTALEKKGVL